MKKNILIIVLCLSLVLITNGCNKTKPSNFKDTYKTVAKYFSSPKKDENISAISYDEKNQIITIILIDNSKAKQEEVLNEVNVDEKYIKFEQGGPNRLFDAEISILDSKKNDTISFTKYFTKNDRNVYLENNIAELYIFDHQYRMSFKDYAVNTNQSLENSIKSVTDLLDKWDSLKDGGTTIYKGKDKNMTVIVCNTLEGNKDVYIGDYNLSHNDAKCR